MPYYTRNLSVIGGSQNTGVADLLSARFNYAIGEATLVRAGNQAFNAHSSTSITATNINLGTAFAGREIWIVIPTMDSSTVTGTKVSSVTIGGNSATSIYQHSATNATTNNVTTNYFRYYDNGALGSAATVVVTFSTNQVHSGIIIFASSLTSTTVDSYSADAVAGNAPTPGSIDTNAGGWAIYSSIKQNTASEAVANFDNDFSFDAGSNEWATVAYNVPTDGSSISVVTGSGSTTGTSVIAAISRV